jgi:hypothetical protein
MVSRRWVILGATLLLACGEEKKPGTVGEGGPIVTPNPVPEGGSGGGSGGNGFVFYSVGDVLDAGLSWQGFAEGSGEPGTITLADYHDPTGEKGIRALLITEGQADCAPCVQEAKVLQKKMAGPWLDRGTRVVQLLVSDASGKPATTSTAQAWKTKIQASWAVGIDPDFTFAQVGSNPYPIQVLVDPRTLTIVDRFAGYRPELPEVEALAEKNR